jgi:hypothetical protein
MISQSSLGIPRNINNICFNALSIGYALNKKTIDRNVVEEVLADRKIESLLSEEGVPPPSTASQAACDVPAFQIPRQKPSRAAFIAVAALITAVLALAALGRGWQPPRAAVRQLLTAKPSAAVGQDGTQPAAELPGPSLQPPPESNVAKPVVPAQNLVAVEPQQTLAEISRRYLGEYSPATVAKLRTLNPTLTNPDHIEVGQQIRLPVDRTNTANEAGAESRSQ